MKVKKVQRFTLHGDNEFVLAKDYDSRERELLARIAQLQSELAAASGGVKCDCRDAFGRHLPECPKFSGGTKP